MAVSKSKSRGQGLLESCGEPHWGRWAGPVLDTQCHPDKGRVQATKSLWLLSHFAVEANEGGLSLLSARQPWGHRAREGEVWACPAPQQGADSRGLTRSLSPFCNIPKMHLSLASVFLSAKAGSESLSTGPPQTPFTPTFLPALHREGGREGGSSSRPGLPRPCQPPTPPTALWGPPSPAWPASALVGCEEESVHEVKERPPPPSAWGGPKATCGPGA